MLHKEYVREPHLYNVHIPSSNENHVYNDHNLLNSSVQLHGWGCSNWNIVALNICQQSVEQNKNIE